MGAVTVPSPPALTQSAFAPSSGRASAGVELTATRSRRGRRRHSGKGNLICGPSRRRWPARQDQRNATRPQGFAAEGDRMGRHPSGQNLQRLPPKFGNLHRRAVLLRNAFTGNSSCLPRFVSKALSQRRQARCEAARPAPAKQRPARSIAVAAANVWPRAGSGTTSAGNDWPEARDGGVLLSRPSIAQRFCA
jgi:hypothetical protein